MLYFRAGYGTIKSHNKIDIYFRHVSRTSGDPARLALVQSPGMAGVIFVPSVRCLFIVD